MKIKLSDNKHALVDEEDFDFLNKWKWSFDGRYACRRYSGEKIYMHRLINNTPEGFDTDHINKYKLDNRKANLRTCNRSYNNLNQPIRTDNKSGYKGVSWREDAKKWRARIYIDKVEIHLGLFSKLEDAIKARKNYVTTFL